MPQCLDLLVCGISTHLQQEAVGLDERAALSETEFSAGGLKAERLIRSGFMALPRWNKAVGTIGVSSTTRRRKLPESLSAYLTP